MAKKFVTQLRELIELDKSRKQRARARALLPDFQGQWWCLGLLGFNTSCHKFEFASGAILRIVEDPPSAMDLANVLQDPNLMYAIGRYSASFRYEIAINREIVGEFEMATIAACIASGLRIRTLSDVLFPAIADQSWSTIVGKDEHSVIGLLFEDVPKAQQFEPEKLVSEDDLKWVSNNLSCLRNLLLTSPAFGLAADALMSHNHAPNNRLTATALWSGIEALFDISAELRFRLASYVATVLEKRGAARLQKYRDIKRLYDARSKIVHGATMDDAALVQHILDVRNVLSLLLCFVIERGAILSSDEVEELLFEAP